MWNIRLVIIETWCDTAHEKGDFADEVSFEYFI